MVIVSSDKFGVDGTVPRFNFKILYSFQSKLQYLVFIYLKYVILLKLCTHDSSKKVIGINVVKFSFQEPNAISKHWISQIETLLCCAIIIFLFNFATSASTGLYSWLLFYAPCLVRQTRFQSARKQRKHETVNTWYTYTIKRAFFIPFSNNPRMKYTSFYFAKKYIFIFLYFKNTMRFYLMPFSNQNMTEMFQHFRFKLYVTTYILLNGKPRSFVTWNLS